MKQFKLTFLFTMLMSMVGAQAYAYHIAVENADGVTIYYNYINDDSELEVTAYYWWESDYENKVYKGNVVIPNEVTYKNGTYKVTRIGESAFSGCSSLTSVTIPNSVTSIGRHAFSGCTGLTSLTLPDGLETIEYCVFSGCTGLTSLTLPDGLETIEYGAFSGCTGLTSLTLPDGLATIGYDAFSGCTGLTSLTLPDGLATIGNGAFSGCTGLTSLTLPDGLATIGNEAFSGCTGLTSLTLPDGLETIEYGAFSGCSSLTSVTIPNSVTSIGDHAFRNCRSLISLDLPNSIKTIGGNAFENCYSLEYLSIPKGVKDIGSWALSGCGSLLAIMCHAVEPPRVVENLGNSNAFLFVPDGSVEAYKAADGWKSFLFIYSESDNFKFKVNPSLGRSNLFYYDYDGDGIIEMLGNYTQQNSSSIGWMSDKGLIADVKQRGLKELADVKQIGFKEIKGSLNIANGGGRLMLGGYLEQPDGSWTLVPDYSNRMVPIDADSDGRMDLIIRNYDSNITALMQQADGTFVTLKPQTEEDPAVVEARMAEIRKGSNPLNFNIVVSSIWTPEGDIYMGVDLNSDGRPDLLGDDGKNVFFSLGENTYYAAEFTGKIFPYDLNGDGIQDYLLYEDGTLYTVICNADGGINQQQVFQNQNITDFICRDFDHDGDVDVLLYLIDTENTFFVFLRNDGDGSFKRKESYIEEIHNFFECKDYDADGLYEIMVTSYYFDKNGHSHGKDKRLCRIFKVGEDFSLTEVSEDLPEEMIHQFMDMGDFDNDGYTDFKLVVRNTKVRTDDYEWVGDHTLPHITGHYSKQTQQNTAPQQMEKPMAQLDEMTGMMRIMWQQGQDAETSPCDLTYELRIGTEPGRGDVLFATSLADGRRRVITDGNMGTLRQTLFNIDKHQPGTYYISVQAVDQGGLGGAWSEEFVYEHTFTAPALSAGQYKTTTADTLLVVAGSYIEGTEYKWKVSNGEVISQQGNQALVQFHAAGPQTVGLTAVRGAENYQSKPITVTVEPYKMLEHNSNSIVTFDLNMDGYADGICSYGYVMINDGQGNLSRYPKSFNADLELYGAKVFDLNHDGYPDFMGIISSGSKGNVYLNDQEGDFECENRGYEIKWNNHANLTGDYNTQSYTLNNQIGPIFYKGEWADFCNTGEMRIIVYDGIFDVKDYTKFEWHNLEGFTSPNSPELLKISDYNRDGFMDIFCMVYSGGRNLCALLGNADGSFQKMTLLENVPYQRKGLLIADLNNDGYQDVLVMERNTLKIYQGKADNSVELVHTVDLFGLGDKLTGLNFPGFIGQPRDYDNNGYLDVCVAHGDEYVGLYFKPDFDYDIIQNIEGMGGYDPFVVMKNDGYPMMENSTILSTIKNLSPKAPQTVSVKQDEVGLVINWSDAEDDHTPAMQMRYNVSVKRKGKKGDNSYIISPMNGGSSQSNLVFPYAYKQSTTMTVPLRALTAGETYEVQVQAIDLWNQYSPMTEPVDITITDGGYIMAPSLAATDRETIVRYKGTSADDVTCQPGQDGTVVSSNGDGEFVLSWSTPGVKTVTIGQLYTQVVVRNPIDVSFSVPEKVYAGVPVEIEVSDEMAAQAKDCHLSIINLSDDSRAYDGTHLSYTSGSKTATLNFSMAGDYLVVATSEDPIFFNRQERIVHVVEQPQAVITSVEIDETMGKYAISWPTDYDSDIVAVEVMKENTSLNNYTVLATASIGEGRYLDLTSHSMTKAERYKIALLTSGGQRIESAPHKPLHVMIGQSALGGYHLIWNAYEGLTVDNYQLLRGTSASELQVIDQVAGSQQSYTDQTAPEGELFYAVAFTPVKQAGAHRRATSADGVRSNVISTAKAETMTLATSLKITTHTVGQPKLEVAGQTLQLYYILLPIYCTFDKVAWSIVDGADLATITADGLLTAKEKEGVGYETVTVRAESLDGSNLSDEIQIRVKLKVPEPEITVTADSFTRPYGDENPVFTYVVSGGTPTGEPEIICEATETSPVGTYPIVIIRGTLQSNKLNLLNGTLTIEPATLTASVGNYSREQGEDNPEFTILYDGWKNGEDESVLTVLPTAVCEATAESEPGDYPIIVSGGEAQNYTFDYINGTLTITAPSGIAKLTDGQPVDVFTPAGFLVRSKVTSLKGLPKGVYVVRSGNGRHLQKVAVK